jgi:O-antigen/teichoic acid export membrane protein
VNRTTALADRLAITAHHHEAGRLVRTVAQSIGTQIFLMPLGLVGGVVAARYLGPEDRGIYTLVLLIPSTVIVFANIGLESAVTYLHNRRHIDLGRLVANSLVYAFLAGGLVASTLWFGRTYLASLFTGLSPLYLGLALALIPLRMVNHSLNAILKAAHDFPSYNRRARLEGVLAALGLLLALVVFRGGVLSCLIATNAVLVSVALWLMVDVRKHVPRLPPPNLRLMREMLAYGVKTYGNTLANHIHMKVDVYLVAYYLTNAEIAFYSIGVKLAERILMLPNTATTVLFPRLAASGDQAGADLTARVCRMTVFTSALCAVVVLLTGRTLIGLLYGSAYLPAAGPMCVVIAGVAAVGLVRQLGNYLKCINQHHQTTYVLLGGGVINVLLNFILIPEFRIMGAAFSSLVSYIFQAVVLLAVFTRLTGVPWMRTVLVTRQDLAYVTQHMKVAVFGLFSLGRSTKTGDSCRLL